MAQRRTQQEKPEYLKDVPQSISVCDIMHGNANNVIEKMESLLPINLQMYSDFYTECLHSMQDLFGACYISENEILSKLGINQKVLQSFGDYTKAFTSSAISQIEMANNIQKTLLQNQISAVKVSDEYIRLMLGYYAKTLDYYAKALAGSPLKKS